MPPRCCNPTQHIPLKHVDKLFDLKFKMKWNAKYQEYTTKNRIYCPRRGCGEWIKPGNIHVDMSGGTQGGRKYAKCGRCRMKVCVACNGKWHTSRTCPKDDATRQFIEIAQREGWQRCYNCSATVELKEGCNHMTCRCKAEFCMICGNKWKSCDCPWFNYETVEQDRLLHMNVPGMRRVVVDAATPAQARGYQAEMDARREQERRDEALARRMAVLGLDNPGVEMYQVDAGDDEDFAVGNAARHHLNTHHRREEVPIPEEPPGPPPVLRQHSLASRQYNNRRSTRPSERAVPRRVATDYVSEVQMHAPVEVRRHSVLAGLTGGGTAEGRVAEWRQYVEI
ncbi:MAG: hypothetical protein LQ351_004137 [Letrouitia transgressa]|nr:MAG: hypothetical protein LQ351_004137 [Letrouitia transgressa]